jgi:hypothetical protein
LSDSNRNLPHDFDGPPFDSAPADEPPMLVRREHAGRPDSSRPDTGRPDSSRPDTGRPDSSRPDTGRPQPVAEASPSAEADPRYATGAYADVRAVPRPSAQPQARRGGGAGCWLAALVTVLVAFGLIGAALFLPPFSVLDRVAQARFTALTPGAATLSTAGFTVTAAELSGQPGAGQPQAAQPPADVGARIEALPLAAFVDASAARPAWAAAALAAAPPRAAPQSDVFTLHARSTGAGANVPLVVEVAASPSINPDLLDLYRYEETAGGGVWRFMESEQRGGAFRAVLTAAQAAQPQRFALFQAAPPEQPTVLVSVDVTQVLSPEAAQIASIVAPGGLQPTLDGALAGTLAPGFDPNAGYLIVPTVRNYTDPLATDPATVSAILNNTGTRSAHVAQLVNFASAGGYDGVIVDYRDLAPNDGPAFSAFVGELGARMDAAGLVLGVVVPAPTFEAGTLSSGAYDWGAIGAAADLVEVTLPTLPTAFAPGADRPVEAILRWAVGQIAREKLVIGLSARSARQINGDITPISYDEALSALGDVRITAETTATGTIEPGSRFEAALDGYAARFGVDEASSQPYVDYLNPDGLPASRMWLTTADALRARMDRAVPFAIGGVAFDDLNATGLADGVMAAILDFKMNLPDAYQAPQFALRWTIEGREGTLAEVTTALGVPLVATLQAPDGEYAVNVAIVGGASGAQAESRRAGAAVAVYAPTLTPTPLPTATPTPTPAPTSTPVRVAAPPAAAAGAPAAPSGGGQAAARPGAGSIAVGSFEYGGHVTSTNTGASGAMRSAGMNWMKVQIRYSPGTGTGDAVNSINGARAQGFKVLLGLVGYPGDVAAAGTGYIPGFAAWVGSVAALGPDAIEIWNEPNIDREWPTGQISGEFYTQLLRESYLAAKAANSGVMVISGAPAPTGAEAAFPGQVVNDDNFIRQMVAAGALNYMDCLGAHYNEGIVPPSARSGDPRDGYYTRYFYGMLDTYWNLIGGAKPICFTELGYLTSEGFPPLPSYFAWAQNVTLGQQAAWLAEAAALASQSGRVRLLIVWNVDFTNYGSDPMAGFAMIRPDGSCPACSAMAGAR